MRLYNSEVNEYLYTSDMLTLPLAGVTQPREMFTLPVVGRELLWQRWWRDW